MVKTRILSNENLCVDFPKCISLFLDFIKQKTAADGPLTQTIAQVSRKRGREGSSVQVEDRFYSKKEYCALMPDQSWSFATNARPMGISPETNPVRKANLETMSSQRAL